MIETNLDGQVTAENTTWVQLKDGRGFIAKSMGSVVVLERVDVVVGHFVYITIVNVCLRETASYAHARSVGLKSGSVVEASALVRAEGTLFVLLSNGSGWLFESKDSAIVLEPAAIEDAVVHVRCASGVIVRETASYMHPAMISEGRCLVLKSGAIICCDRRLSTEGTTFFRLSNGKGWVTLYQHTSEFLFLIGYSLSHQVPESDSPLNVAGETTCTRVRILEPAMREEGEFFYQVKQNQFPAVFI